MPPPHERPPPRSAQRTRPQPARARVAERGLHSARTYPQWGHRKICAMIEAEHAPSQSTVLRLLRDHDLTVAIDDRHQVRQLARVRREVFREDFDHRNRVWQTDFTEIETSQGGDWQIQPVIDYVTKLCLACHVSTTQAASDLCQALDDASAHAQALIGVTLLDDVTCPDSGLITPVFIVSDNGPAFKSIRFERYVLVLHPRAGAGESEGCGAGGQRGRRSRPRRRDADLDAYARGRRRKLGRRRPSDPVQAARRGRQSRAREGRHGCGRRHLSDPPATVWHPDLAGCGDHGDADEQDQKAHELPPAEALVECEVATDRGDARELRGEHCGDRG